MTCSNNFLNGLTGFTRGFLVGGFFAAGINYGFTPESGSPLTTDPYTVVAIILSSAVTGGLCGFCCCQGRRPIQHAQQQIPAPQQQAAAPQQGNAQPHVEVEVKDSFTEALLPSP